MQQLCKLVSHLVQMWEKLQRNSILSAAEMLNVGQPARFFSGYELAVEADCAFPTEVQSFLCIDTHNLLFPTVPAPKTQRRKKRVVQKQSSMGYPIAPKIQSHYESLQQQQTAVVATTTATCLPRKKPTTLASSPSKNVWKDEHQASPATFEEKTPASMCCNSGRSWEML